MAQARDKVPGPDIVVRGLKDRKRGTWRRADGAHVIVYSKEAPTNWSGSPATSNGCTSC
ncbi:hypothetical protein MOP88_08470 [Sphingomonas sp. WKB10]|nr:hypothetical protein [Sphingomonas sp. WKB10]